MAQLSVSTSKLSAHSNTPAMVGTADTTKKNQDLNKTKLCVYYLRGSCNAGVSCRYAHHVSEIRSTPNLTKTQLCVKFMNGNCCNKACTYAHGEAELVKPPNFKKKMCAWFRDGNCRNGASCGFAHSRAECSTDVPIGTRAKKSEFSGAPWRRAEASDDGDTSASTDVPSSHSQVESDTTADASADTSDGCSTSQKPEENLFRMMAARGSAPLEHQVASVGLAIGDLQTKLDQVGNAAALQAQVEHMQKTIHQLSEQCAGMKETKSSKHRKNNDAANRVSTSTQRCVRDAAASKPAAKTLWEQYGARATFGVVALALMVMVELTLQ